MQTIALLWGILSILFMLVGFLPCLGGLNWLVIPFAAVGIIVCGLALAQSPPNNRSAAAGLILCAIAVFFGMIRLFVGGGLL